MARAIQGTMNLDKKFIDNHYNSEQKCNFYKEELVRLEKRNTENYSPLEMEDLLNKMEYYAYLIDLYAMESKEEWLYLPHKKIKLESISDLIYFERLYGGTIYEEKEY